MKYITYRKKKYASMLLALAFVSTLTGCGNQKNTNKDTTPTPTVTAESPTDKRVVKNGFKLNTIVTITLYGDYDESIIDGAFALCDQYENLLSRTKTSSEIYQLNNSPDRSLTVSDDTLELLQTGLNYCSISNGAFDLSVEPLTSLWNFGNENQRLPEPSEINEALTHIGYQDVKIDGNTVTLTKNGMGLDLGAIAKGYIADKIKEYLLEQGVTCATINLGGNVLCVGAKPDGSPFKIGIQKPYEDRSETIAVMELGDKSVVSSGIYERYFEVDGVKYHHILNPSTGYPYDNNLLSVTIVSDKSTDGDALSTTCFALGLEKGLELIDSMDNTYAVFITKDDQLHYSKGFLEAIPTLETK
ncbi:MAG: FAD:protein FMN transferase [Clostridiales bacterium]|nr:FAD:protein FMN transferase [Clostridiales bacterium]